jgi:hypothetical protein
LPSVSAYQSVATCARFRAGWNADDVVAAQEGSSGDGGRRSARTIISPPLSGHRRKPTPGSGNGAGTISRSTPRLSAPNISLTPSFINVQPAEYTDANGAMVRPLGGDPANHIHGIYRDPTNDYGAKYAQ